MKTESFPADVETLAACVERRNLLHRDAVVAAIRRGDRALLKSWAAALSRPTTNDDITDDERQAAQRLHLVLASLTTPGITAILGVYSAA